MIFPLSRSDPNYAATLSSIIIIFFICHVPRIVKTVLEIVVTNEIKASGQTCSGINPAKCLSNLNNFILTLNASASFVVYCFVGTFGTAFAQVLTSCCRRTPPTADEAAAAAAAAAVAAARRRCENGPRRRDVEMAGRKNGGGRLPGGGGGRDEEEEETLLTGT